MPQDFIKYFTDTTNQLKSEHRYREFVDISRLCKDFPYAINNKNGHNVVLWCSNDYLAMGQNVDAINAGKKAIDDCLKQVEAFPKEENSKPLMATSEKL